MNATTGFKVAPQKCCAWRSLETVVMERYVRLDEQIALCYTNIQLVPSPGDLQHLFREAGGAL